MAKSAKAEAKYYGTGRRKKSIARVYLVPGKGDITNLEGYRSSAAYGYGYC